MSTKHTPGPWSATFGTTATGEAFVAVVGDPNAQGSHGTLICNSPDPREYPRSAKEFATNANLIAAEHVEVIGGHGVSYTPPYKHWLQLPAAPSITA